MFLSRICGTLVNHSSVISLYKKSSWFYTYLYYDKQIFCIGSSTVHIFNRTVGSSYVKIDGRIHSLSLYIYIYRERERASIHKVQMEKLKDYHSHSPTPSLSHTHTHTHARTHTHTHSLVWIGLVGFYGISTIVGYLMPNPLYTYILHIHVKCKHTLQITYLNVPELFFVLS